LMAWKAARPQNTLMVRRMGFGLNENDACGCSQSRRRLDRLLDLESAFLLLRWVVRCEDIRDMLRCPQVLVARGIVFL